MVSFTVHNLSTKAASIRLTYSMDNGKTWTSPSAGQITVEPNSKETTAVNLPNEHPILLRINQTNGSAQAGCYLDDIKLYYSGYWPPVGDVDGDGDVNINDVNLLINIILGESVDDDTFKRADVNEDKEISVADINALINIILG